jgi:hypothetical protein
MDREEALTRSSLKNTSWCISSLLILDKNNSLLLKRIFKDVNFEIQHKVLTDYLKALKNFTHDILNSPLQEVVFEDKRIIFSTSKNYSIIILIYVNPDVETGPGSQIYRILNIFVKSLEKWVEKFFENNQQKTYFKYIDTLVDELTTKIHSIDPKLFKYNGKEIKFELVYSFILNRFGQPIFTKIHTDDLKVDPFLIFTFLSALTSFSSTYLNFHLQQMVFGDYRFFFNVIDNKMYGLVVRMNQSSTVSSLAMEKTYSFLNEMSESLDMCFNESDFDESLIVSILDNLTLSYK